MLNKITINLCGAYNKLEKQQNKQTNHKKLHKESNDLFRLLKFKNDHTFFDRIRSKNKEKPKKFENVNG